MNEYLLESTMVFEDETYEQINKRFRKDRKRYANTREREYCDLYGLEGEGTLEEGICDYGYQAG